MALSGPAGVLAHLRDGGKLWWPLDVSSRMSGSRVIQRADGNGDPPDR